MPYKYPQLPVPVLILLGALLIACHSSSSFAQVMPADTSVPGNMQKISLTDNLKQASELSHLVKSTADYIDADIFILDTKDPSILKVYSPGKSTVNTVISKRKLEMKSKHTSAFKIININPLRYNYYINGQSITQFMDSSPASAVLNELIGTAPVNDIVSLDVFGFDKEVLNQKIEIDKAKEELKVLLKDVEFEQQDLISLLDSSKTTDNPIIKKDLNIQHEKKYARLQTATNSLIEKLTELNLMLNKLAINANSVSIITGLEKSLGKCEDPSILGHSIGRMNYYIREYLTIDATCSLIKQKLNNLPNQPENLKAYLASQNQNPEKRQVDSELIALLNKIKYPTDKLSMILSSNDLKYVVQQRLEVFRIEEYITDKKISSLGNLLTELYLEVGKLLQDGYIEYSRQLNRIKNLNYITDEDRAEVQNIAEQIKSIFGTIQTVNAHVSVLIVFMQINNAQSRDLGKTINSLYKSFLNFLKITDYIKDGTTNKYTLAMHPNGSNIDLIRYTVKQEEVLTKHTQSYVYDIWLKGGLKIDFSVGIFATGLVDEAYEKKAFFVNDPAGSHISDTSFSLGLKDKGKFGFAFGGMVNISPRLGSAWFTPGLSLGIAYGDNQNLQFLTVGSLHLGKSERILLHAGCVMGAAKVLDKSAIVYVDPSNTYVRGNINNYPVPLVDKFLGKFIFGISYNLSKKNALQAVSGQGLTKFNSSMSDAQ